MSGMPASRLFLSGIAGRFHDLLFDDAQAPWQRSRAQHHGHGVGVFEREATRYHPRAAQDRLADHGDREHLAVENDREWLPHIVLGNPGEASVISSPSTAISFRTRKGALVLKSVRTSDASGGVPSSALVAVIDTSTTRKASRACLANIAVTRSGSLTPGSRTRMRSAPSGCTP